MINNIVYNTDCFEYMKTIPDKFFDVCIADPPYGICEDGTNNNSRSKITKSKNYKGFDGGDITSPNKEVFDEMIRISKNQIIFGANHFISKLPYDSSCWIVWDKDNGETDFADCELAWTSFDTSVRKFKYKWQGMLQEKMKNKEVRIHPTQKPVDLYKWILDKYTKENDKIFDPFIGSGSIRIACDELGRSLVGCETSEYYFNEQEKRFNNYKLQLKLF